MSTALIPYANPDLYFESYPSQLTPVLKDLCRNSSSKEILSKIVAEQGKLTVRYHDFNDMAEWDWKKKTISLNTALMLATKANQLAYLLFEICNASKTAEFTQIIQNTTNVEEFVERFERLEHQSALKTNELAVAILGENESFHLKYINPDFTHHYALEQISGHSEQIASRYFPGQPYEGTLYHRLSALSIRERVQIYALLYHRLRSSPQEFGARLMSLRKIAALDASYRKAVDCALQLFPDQFAKDCPPIKEVPEDFGTQYVVD